MHAVLECVFAVVGYGGGGGGGYEEVAEGVGEVMACFVVVDDEVGVRVGIEWGGVFGWGCVGFGDGEGMVF